MQKNEILWTAAFLNERFAEPVSPLGWSFVGSLFEETALRDPLRYMGFPQANLIPATRLWHAHPYVNVEIFQIFYKPFPDALVPADAVRYFPNGDISFRLAAPYPSPRYSLRLLGSLALHLLGDPINASPLNYLKWNRFVNYHTATLATLATRLDAATNPQEILQITAQTYALDRQLLRIHRWSLTYADLFYKILAQWTGGLAQELISHIPNKTREMNAELEAMAQLSTPLTRELLEKIRAGAPLHAEESKTADALQSFLARHGHRSFSLDIAQPSFRDDPTQLLPLLRQPPPNHAAPHESFQALRARAEPQLAIWQRPLFRPVLTLARRYTRLREDQRYYWQKSLAETRRAYLKLSTGLVQAGVIGEPEDIFYATREEISDYFSAHPTPREFGARIAARNQEWESFRDKTYSHFLRGDVPVYDARPAPDNGTEWHGRGISPGIAQGVARVVHEPRDLGRVGAGEILVAPSTDPAWTPVFARLAGLALERGGVLSHGAVVAREYHLPAVAAVPNLTQEIHDGDLIQVDGTNGVVKKM